MSYPQYDDRMAQMMRALGVDPMEVETRHEALYRTMQIRCAGCPAKNACHESIAADKAARVFGRICANVEEMRWLKATPAVLSD